MKMPLKSEIGDIGLYYGYGGIRVNFSTNNRYPYVSVILLLHSKEPCTQSLSLCASKI